MRHYTENQRLWESYSKTVHITESREHYANEIRHLLEVYLADPDRVDEGWADKFTGAVKGLVGAAGRGVASAAKTVGSGVASAARAVGAGASQIGANVGNIAKAGAAAGEAKAQVAQLDKILKQATQLVNSITSQNSEYKGLVDPSMSLADLEYVVKSIQSDAEASLDKAKQSGFTQGVGQAARGAM
jgi:hypothetical protein